MKRVEIYTDGACSGNPGPGGWAAILTYRGKSAELSGYEAVSYTHLDVYKRQVERCFSSSRMKKLLLARY